MNVISYEIEIKRSKFLGFNQSDKEKSVYDLVADSFGDELEIKNNNLKESLESEWEEIGHSELKAIFNKKNCCGYSTTENLKLFLFEKSNSAARSKNNITVDLIAFGKLDATKILNHSFLKIKEIISSKKLTCSYIDGAQAFIFPFDTQGNDIYSYELKVKADLISRFTINNKVYSRWIIMIIGFLVALILKNNGPATSESDTTTTESGVMDSIIASFIFYLLVELVIYYVIPFFTQKNKKHLKISNLSSFIESSSSNSGTTDSESNTNFETPNI
ncbi:hypothetical protein [Aestuariibaculum marinum]|uniref:Uncharacterized protein n=1 Tax=Aestuariibaculum marinum TaxID=2683592 RepID=A0A8J6Q6G5_9FLAO|nr:hypothetical protein [Aestuariibaculum marinum]MBD0824448.1 hypothetical protein [Aestuariibaculum marinum]